MPRRLAVLARLWIALLSLAWTAAAAADSWSIPERQTYFSADRRMRLVVTPNRALARRYLEGPDSAENPAANARGRLERRGADRRWRLVWERPLVNEVAPVSALVADSGDYVVTFDNWGSVGGGDNVVVIYGADGRLVRTMSLTDFLPEDYILTLPQTFSSIWWGGFDHQHHLASDGDRLILSVVIPSTHDDFFWDGQFELEVALATGTPVRSGPAWERAMAAAEAARIADRERRARRLEFMTEPLTAPSSSDRDAWDSYLREAFKRLAPDWQMNNARNMLVRPPGAPAFEGAFSPDPRTIFGERHLPRAIAIASPEGVHLVTALAPIVERRRAGWLNGIRLYIVADDSVWPGLVSLFTPSGATLIQLDPSEPIPQRPERLPPPA